MVTQCERIESSNESTYSEEDTDMNRDDLRQVICGVITTVPTAFDRHLRLDLETMAERSHWWADHGLVAGKSVIKVAAAMGEGPDLGDDEWPHLLRTVVNAVSDRATVVCGLKTKDTLHAIEDAKRAQDLGAVGVQVDLPIFHHPTQDDYLRYFTDISDATDIGILIYNTWWFGAESIAPETLLRLADTAEHVVAVKWRTPNDEDYDRMTEFAPVLNVIDNAIQPIRCHKNGGRGFISSISHAYPEQDLKVWQLMEERKYDEALAEFERFTLPIREFGGVVGRRSGGYQLQKAMMAAIDLPVGDPRPPTLPLTAKELDSLKRRMASLGWPGVVEPATF